MWAFGIWIGCVWGQDVGKNAYICLTAMSWGLHIQNLWFHGQILDARLAVSRPSELPQGSDAEEGARQMHLWPNV